MPKYETATGTVSVHNWGYMLQGAGGHMLNPDLLASATHDLLVIDSSRDGTNAKRFTEDGIDRMQDGMGGRSVVASYISIGEAADFRDYWDKDWTTTGKASGRLTDAAPDWLGPLNPDWPESRKVRYWDQDWQDLMFNEEKTGDLDFIVDAGFDAAYLDIVDAYYFWGAEAKNSQREPGDPKNEKQAAQKMVDFIVEMTDHARETNPDFFVIPQNGAWILDALKNGNPDDVRIEKYLGVIGGIAIEDLYYRGGKDENNALRPDEQTIKVLQRDFLKHDIPVYVVDYINGKNRVDEFNKLALKDGFIPFASPDRDLNKLVGTYDGDPAYIQPTGGNDKLRGSNLKDTIDGLAGNDKINARDGDDKLIGGLGKDILIGGEGADRFLFNDKLGKSNVDTIRDFEAGNDRFQLDHRIFKTLETGALDEAAFVTGEGASNADHRIIYDSQSGDLFYDVDGAGGAKQVRFAVAEAGLALTADDFMIV